MFTDCAVLEGGYINDKRNGQGKLTLINGDIYEGGWISGRKWLWKMYICADCTIYIGNWKDDSRHGQGDIDDEKNGKGKCLYANRTVYEGGYIDYKRNDQGKYIYASRTVYEGGWKDVFINGQGKYKYAVGG